MSDLRTFFLAPRSSALLPLVFILLALPLLASCDDDTNEPAPEPFPTLLSPAKDAVIRAGSDLVIEVGNLDPAREKKIFYRFQGSLYYHSVADNESIRVTHSLTGVPFGEHRLDVGIQKPDDTQEIFETRYIQYLAQ